MKKFFGVLVAFGLCTFILVSAQETTQVRRTAADPIAEMKSRKIETFTTIREDIQICRYVIQSLQNEHYNAQPITPVIAERWFNNYFDILDPLHALFTQADIDGFRPYASVMWDRTRKLANTEFAFKVFALYLQRLRERALFELDNAGGITDFTGDETIKFDRKEEPFPANEAELKGLWKKILKNKLLNIKMVVEKDEIKGDEDDEDDDDEDEKRKSPKAKKTEAERIVEMHKRNARQFNYKAVLERTDVLQLFLNSLCDLYDPHTCYMTPQAKDDMEVHLSLKLQGIGATLTTDEEYTKIVEVIEGSPAEKSGRLRKGDRIVAVAQDGEEPVDVIDMPLNKVVKQIRGPKGTKVTLTILPEGSRDTYDVTIIRDEIQTPEEGAKSSITEIKLNDGTTARVLVLFLPSFYTDFRARFAGVPNYRSTTRDMLALIKKEKDALDGIIIDLRGNGGGGLDESVDLSGLFFPSGNVVQKKNHDGRVEYLADKENNTYFSGPLIIMVDGNSASAAEIMAAALQDMGRALIVGDVSTHGKGTVQITRNFRSLRNLVAPKNAKVDLGGIKVTIAKFYRINGGATQINGVTPDIILPSLLDNSKSREKDYQHPLPWDEIASVPYFKYKEVQSLREPLKKLSEQRMANNKDYIAYKEEIAFCKKFDEDKNIPLNIDKRRKYEEDYRRYEKIYRTFYRRGKNYYKPRKGSKKPLPKDFMLEETLNIMKDYLETVNKTPEK
ncbi:MAG: carboxy terminal-processing peptidase [Victivallales bacterium]|nr:carboxy terminal-processing peptidase [Victivallales bacterium]